MNSESATDLRSVPAAEARALLKEQQESELNIAAFARSKGVQPWALYNARAIERRKAARERSARFAEVQVVDRQPSSSGAIDPIELALPSGVVLRVRRDFDEVALRRLLGVLGSC